MDKATILKKAISTFGKEHQLQKIAEECVELAMQYVKLVQAINPKWVLWENVPGVFSTNGGRDFQRFIFELAKCGLSLSWRILDARFFGVPQRRRRVFLVGHSGEWANSYKVLFERESLCGNPAPRRKTGKEIAKCLTRGLGTRLDSETDTFVTGTQCASGAGLSRPAGQGNELDFCVVHGSQDPICNSKIANTVQQNNGLESCILQNKAHAVRRLTPLECERLQGFPDNYTNVESASDTARYKALGNSMCVNVMRWIAERMSKVDKHIS